MVNICRIFNRVTPIVMDTICTHAKSTNRFFQLNPFMSRDLYVILLMGDITNTFILYNHIRHLTLACCCALLLTGAFFASIGLRSIDHSHQFSRLCLTKSDQIDLGLLPPIPCQVKRAQTRQCATKRVARDSHPHSSLRHNLGPCFESLRTAA